MTDPAAKVSPGIMQWGSALSLESDAADAVRECGKKLRVQFRDRMPDLVIAFPSRDHMLEFRKIPDLLRRELPKALVFGCSAGGVIGAGSEAEGMPALSVSAAALPGVKVSPLRIDSGDLPSLDDSPRPWKSLLGLGARSSSVDHDHLLLLADPFTSQIDLLLKGLDYGFPDTPKFGGLASAASSAGGNALFLGDDVFDDGVIGLGLSGNLRVDTVVAQGGRPVGQAMSVTKCRRNVIHELDGQPALRRLQQVVESIPEQVGPHAKSAMFLGILADELEDNSGEKRYLIRNLLGVDPNVEAIAIGDLVREGQVVCFHLCNADTASEDLRRHLTRYRRRPGAKRATGALLFSCNGRGTSLFGRPNHDTDLFRELLGKDVPLGGFFCSGEIGPVGNQTFVHGFTSSFGIFRPLEGFEKMEMPARAEQEVAAEPEVASSGTFRMQGRTKKEEEPTA